ncbi:hypothetical protein EYF80_003598 [Liparis tanakae]|uniref:Uncharacterized protein n=1 Tax=Liparis tanakae TaxID=230148 RepID=A0A4Z2J8E4_9TELE|nr:hypothetical protein EYF80_003598 [Liparis tanakae]
MMPLSGRNRVFLSPRSPRRMMRGERGHVRAWKQHTAERLCWNEKTSGATGVEFSSNPYSLCSDLARR